MDADILYKEIGYRLQKIRKSLGLTQLELGEKVGLPRASMVRIEKGTQKIAIDKLFLLAEALDVDLEEFLPIIEPSNPFDSVSNETLGEDTKSVVLESLDQKKKKKPKRNKE